MFLSPQDNLRKVSSFFSNYGIYPENSDASWYPFSAFKLLPQNLLKEKIHQKKYLNGQVWGFGQRHDNGQILGTNQLLMSRFFRYLGYLGKILFLHYFAGNKHFKKGTASCVWEVLHAWGIHSPFCTGCRANRSSTGPECPFVIAPWLQSGKAAQYLLSRAPLCCPCTLKGRRDSFMPVGQWSLL